MSTGIQWTDETWNPVTGCTKVSPGCKFCYAETVAERFWATQYPPIRMDPEDYHGQEPSDRPRRFTDVQCHDDRLDQPLRWKKPRRVFVNSMSDLFHEAVSDAFIDRVFAVMALGRAHTFQILTKRAERMRTYLSVPQRRHLIANVLGFTHGRGDAARSVLGEHFNLDPAVTWPLSNVWIGVSVENQQYANERIPLLLDTPASVRFLSVEPLLGQVDLRAVRLPDGDSLGDCFFSHGAGAGLDWVIVGGESGTGARLMDLAWARSLVAQCQAARVPCFVKQLGAKPESVTDHISHRGSASQKPDGFYRFLNDSKGGDPSEWPADLRVRDYPEAQP